MFICSETEHESFNGLRAKRQELLIAVRVCRRIDKSAFFKEFTRDE